MKKYAVIEKQTENIVTFFKSEIRAKRERDKLDNEYGAYRYYVKEYWGC